MTQNNRESGPERPGNRRCTAPLVPHYLLRMGLGDEGADIAADLDEEYTVSRLPQSGRVRATLWYWSQALGSVGHIATVKIRRARRTRKSPRQTTRNSMTNGFLQDLRYGVRTLIHHPGFTAIAVLTLALGIGTNTAVFSVLNSYLFKPLPFREATGLVHIFGTDSRVEGFGWDMARMSAPEVLDLAGQIAGFDETGAYTYTGVNLTGGNEPIGTTLGLVTPNMFHILGVDPALGRGFAPGDGQPGASRVAILSHRLWRTAFGADEGLIGEQVSLDDESYTVIGIMPEGFDFPFGGVRIWSPVELSAAADRRQRSYLGVARLADGASLEATQAELDQVAARLSAEYPENDGIGFRATGLREGLTFFFDYLRLTVLGLAAAVGSVLLIASVNVANMMLARGSSRTSEIALRTAIGAGRARILRQLLTENLVLAFLAGVLGIVLAVAVVNPVGASLPGDIWKAGEVTVDGVVLLYAALLTLGTTLLFGLLPALRVSRTDLSVSLKDGSRGGGRSRKNSRLSNMLITQQLALSLTLLLAAASLLQIVSEFRTLDLGFEPDGVVTASVSLPAARYSGDRISAFYRDVIDNVTATPGVDAAAAVAPLPFDFQTWGLSFGIDGVTDEPRSAIRFHVTPGYFATMRQPLLGGRDFEQSDDVDAPMVVIVNDVFAERFWPGQDPLGRTIRIDPSDDNEIAMIVGVVKSGKLGITASGNDLQVFMPLFQSPRRGIYVVTRAGAGVPITESVRERIWQTDSALPVSVRTMNEVLAQSLGPMQSIAGVLALLSFVALFLAATGIYGVMSHAVSQRLHEFGVRTALGASRRQVTVMVLKSASKIVAAGVVLGIVLAFAADRAMIAFLPDAPGSDPMLYATVSALLAGTGLLASLVPAIRATRVDPVEVLRAQ